MPRSTNTPYPQPSPDQLKILHAFELGPVGGLHRVVEALALGQRGRGHAVHVVAIQQMEDCEHPMLAALESAGVGVIPLVVPARSYIRERTHFLELCRHLCPDVVHTHGYRPDLVDGAAARRLGIPIVSTLHGFTGGGWKNRLYEWLHRRMYRRFDAVVVVSRPLAEQIEASGVAPERIATVPNAWGGLSGPLERTAARRALGLPEEGFRIGWVGRISPEKGVDVLLDALPHLADLPFALSILGDGRERSQLERTGVAAGLADRIRWHGTVADAGRYLSAFDVYVLSSRTEGTPIALFEAMAAGTPIVATRVGGVPDVVTSREALVVAPDDSVAIAVAVRAVYTDPEAATSRARAARERLAEAFAFEPWLDRYDALYRTVRRRRGERTQSRIDPL